VGLCLSTCRRKKLEDRYSTRILVFLVVSCYEMFIVVAVIVRVKYYLPQANQWTLKSLCRIQVEKFLIEYLPGSRMSLFGADRFDGR